MSKRWQLRKFTWTSKVIGHATRLMLAVVVGLSLLGFLPSAAQAQPNPVDLELGGAGATSWNIFNVHPTESGTKTVELRNVGSQDGFITIWISDVFNNEGLNPESETGDTAEPGELDDYLLFNLSADGLCSNLNLPAKIGNLPHTVLGPDFIEIIPLKAGETVNLQWTWELPAGTGNAAQGDSISFTINYLLRECSITDVSSVVTANGTFTETVTAESETGEGKITIAQDTVGQTETGDPVSEIWLIKIDKAPPPTPPPHTTIVNLYDAGPDGTTFDQPITITLHYDDPEDIPAGAREKNLTIALWDKNTGSWVTLVGSTVDTKNNIISAPISHFRKYGIAAYIPPPPPSEDWGLGIPLPLPSPPPPTPPPLPLPPVEELPPTPPEEVVTPEFPLEINMLGREITVQIEADGTLREPLTLTDAGGNFVVEVDSNAKITGSDGILLSRIELTTVEESIVKPEDTVILSPVYKLTGYIDGAETPRINFNPQARLTVSYNPDDLPENTFPPFVAYYTAELGLAPIGEPPDSVVEIGKAKAQISYASLFVVAAKLAPPPPPLPAKFGVGSLTINPGQAPLGQPIVISLTIANEGETEGSYELYLKIDGIIRTVKEVTLPAKSSRLVSFEVSNLAVGTHRVTVAGLLGQFKTVSTAVLPAKSPIDWFTLDLSIAGAVVIGFLLLYLFKLRAR